MALELAHAGKRIVLIEQDGVALNRASLRNEGKIHLGFVYAADNSLSTARLMLEGALGFRRSLARLLGGRTDALVASTPFSYLVANDSVLTPSALSERYHAIEALYLDRLRDDPTLDYLGHRPGRLFRPVRLESLRSRFRIDRLRGAFETEELAVDTDQLAHALRAAIADEPNIHMLAGHRIESVERVVAGFRIEGPGPAGVWQQDAEQVVNCLWENRQSIDLRVGMNVVAGWLHRLKFRVVARLPARLHGAPSVTMVLGRFGDVVIRRDGCGYFSWYPLCLKGWSDRLAPPDEWNAACRGDARPEDGDLGRQILSAIDDWYPGAAEATPIVVDAGVIVAYGRTDVDDPTSGLHERTRIGVTSLDGYHSVDPGKLTTAPWFALRAAREVLGATAAA